MTMALTVDKYWLHIRDEDDEKSTIFGDLINRTSLRRQLGMYMFQEHEAQVLVQ